MNIKLKNFTSLPALRILDICNALHIWECPGPSLLIESTDSMMKVPKAHRTDLDAKKRVKLVLLSHKNYIRNAAAIGPPRGHYCQLTIMSQGTVRG